MCPGFAFKTKGHYYYMCMSSGEAPISQCGDKVGLKDLLVN